MTKPIKTLWLNPKQKPERDEDYSPLNDAESALDQLLAGSICFKYPNAPDLGVLTVETPIGQYAFVIDMQGANEMVQALRDFISGDCEEMSNGE